MSKRSSDGDVLTNKVNLALAKHQTFLNSLLGPKTETDLQLQRAAEQQEEKDLTEDQVDPEKLGIGGVISKHIQDGSFTRRLPTSDDKLLQQLIGKKAAKAHLAAKQASQTNVKPQKYGKSKAAPKKEESEDEEEGRTAAFKSKKRKSNRSRPVAAEAEGEDQPGSDLPMRPADDGAESGAMVEDAPVKEQDQKASKRSGDESEDADVRSSFRKPKSGSFLDEILAERSKKKSKKRSKGKGDA